MTASISTPSRLMSSAFPAALSAFAVGAAVQTGWLAPDSGVAGVLAASVAVGALAAFGRAMFRRAPVNAADEPAAAADEPAAAAARHDVSRRLRALEMSSTLTMLADRDLRIVYLNEALRRMLAEAQSDIRKDLPNFDASALIGACIDVFHVRAEHQRRMIEALKTRHDAEISLGGRFFTLAVSPVLDEAGERIATVVEWRDVTVENRVMRSIDAVVNAANDGEFGARVDAAGATGLLAEMAGKVNRLAETVDVGLGETRRVLGAVAEGDLTQRMQGDFRGAFAALQSSLNTAATKLQSAFAEMKGASSDLETGASGIRDNAEKLAQRTELQATSLEESSASLEQMAVTIKANAENAVRATELSNAASSRAQARTAVVQETVSAMTRIEQSATRIADIIGVIDGIAFQTNLLALNAAVEAARAGEAGKGFAIVASEVRTLAQRSADAANDIRGLIENSSTHVADGVRLVEQTGDALAEIVASFQEVSSAIAEITEAGREQASGVEEVSAAILQMDQTTQQNAEMADASVNASRGLEATASRLSSAMAAFHIADGRQAPSQQPAPRRAAEDRRDREWQAVEKTAPAAAVKAAPVKAASANAASVKSAPAKDASATRASAKAAPARAPGAKEVPAKEVMAKEVLAKDAPAKAAGAGAAAGGDWAEF